MDEASLIELLRIAVADGIDAAVSEHRRREDADLQAQFADAAG